MMDSLPRISPNDFSVEYDEGLKQFESIQQSVMSTMAERGLVLPKLPNTGYAGEMPVNLTALTDGQLGDLLGVIAQYASYVSGQLALIIAELSVAEAQELHARASVRKEIKRLEASKKLTNPDKDDIMETDSRVLEAVKKTLFFQNIKIMTQAIHEKAKMDWDTVSRRITQRGQEVDMQKRTVNANAPGPVFPGWRNNR